MGRVWTITLFLRRVIWVGTPTSLFTEPFVSKTKSESYQNRRRQEPKESTAEEVSSRSIQCESPIFCPLCPRIGFFFFSFFFFPGRSLVQTGRHPRRGKVSHPTGRVLTGLCPGGRLFLEEGYVPCITLVYRNSWGKLGLRLWRFCPSRKFRAYSLRNTEEKGRE